MASGQGTSAASGAASEPPSVQPGTEASSRLRLPRSRPPAAGATRRPAPPVATFSGSVGFKYADHGIDLRRQRPRGRARRPRLARDLPDDRLRRHRRRQPARGGGDARRVQGDGVREPARPSPTTASRPPSRRARPTPSSPATTSRAIGSVGSRSPSPRPELERTPFAPFPDPRRRSHRAAPGGPGDARRDLHRHRR